MGPDYVRSAASSDRVGHFIEGVDAVLYILHVIAEKTIVPKMRSHSENTLP